MPRRKIFLSYSKQDRELCEAFTRHLAPFERSGLLVAWTDRDIQPSDDWDRRIHEAMDDATAAVLLVSPDFLDTDYVVDEEIPRLVEAAEAERLLLTNLFLRRANPEALVVPVLDVTTGEHGIRITKYQGLNRPDEPVVEQPDRDKLLAECARKLWAMLEERPSRREQRRVAEAQELTVELRVRGRYVDRYYLQPGRQNHGEIDVSRLRALLEDRHEELDDLLFEILFGRDSQWQDVLGEKANPLRHGMRLRILTEDPVLQALPWACCRWRGYALAEMGWTFELVADREHPSRVWLDAPCPALMIGAEPGRGEPLRAEAHRASFEALLYHVWDLPVSTRLFRHAETVDAALAELEKAPSLVYVYARAREDDGGLAIVLGDDTVAFGRLAEAMARRPPRVVVLNTLGPCPPAPVIPGVPVLLHLRHERAELAVRSHAQIWWNDVLGGRWDPVRACHELGAEAWRHGTLRTHYETFETRMSDVTPKVDRPRSRLDRRPQREAVMSAVRDLAGNRHRRVTCVVAYGARGNLVEHFAVQVVDTLKDWAHGLARIHRHDLRFPEWRDEMTAADFLARFKDLMHVQPYEDLSTAFPARRGGPGAVPVHFVNWGCYGPGQLAALRASHLEAWLDFCCRDLPAACTDKSRILSYVALVVAPERQEQLRDFFGVLRDQPRFAKIHFEMLLLRPLGEITPADLRAFLAVEDNTSCPPDYRHNVAERICQRTGGEFETTVELLERAEHGMMWPELYHTLPEAAEAPPTPKDFML